MNRFTPRRIAAFALAALAAVTLTAPAEPAAAAPLAGPPGKITGTVRQQATSGTPTPIAYASVLATTLDGAVHFNTTTLANGTYQLDVAPGSYCVSFAPDASAAAVAAYPDRRNCLDAITPVVVAPGGTTTAIDAVLGLGSITGRVVDPTGDPLPDVDVRIRAPGGDYLRYHETDTTGEFALPNLPAGTYCLSVYRHSTPGAADGPCPDGMRRVDVTDGSTATGVVLTAGPPVPRHSGAIAGVITDSESDPHPMAYRWVRATPLDPYGDDRDDETDLDGRYQITGLAPGRYCVRALDDGTPFAGEYYGDAPTCAESQIVTVDGTTVTGVDMALSLGGSISGTVTTPAKAALAHGWVEVRDLETDDIISTQTDANGAYEIAGLSAGRYCVLAYKGPDLAETVFGGGVDCGQATPVTVVAGQPTKFVDIQVVAAGAVTGTVTLPTGLTPDSAAGRVYVRLFRDGVSTGNSTYIDSTGRYQLAGVAPGRYCVVLVNGGGGVALLPEYVGSTAPDRCSSPADIVVTAGQTTNVGNVTMRRGGVISGWVIAPNGLPVDLPSPYVNPSADESSLGRGDGSFVLGGLRTGAYCVEVDGAGLWVGNAAFGGVFGCGPDATRVTVTEGQTTAGVNMMLPSLGSVRGLLTGPAAGDYHLVELHRLDTPQVPITGYSAPYAGGRSEFWIDAPAGTYCVLVRPHVSTSAANASFGGTSSCVGATPVVVPDMADVTGIDIALTRQILQPLAAPARVLDTRPGQPTADGAASGQGPIAGDTVLEVPVGGRVGVPSDAASVALNVTATNTAAPGYLTVFPCGEPRPTASNVNFAAGQTVANAVTARLGSDGTVCVFAKSTSDVVIDVAGYFPTTEGLTPLGAPARVLDTRPGEPTADGHATGQGPIPGETVLEVPVGGRVGVPAHAASVALNVTATNTTAPGYLTVFPCGESRPTASNVNFTAGQTVANAVTARLGAGGKVCVFAKSTADVVVDVAGYYADADGLRPLPAPARLADTRAGQPTFDGSASGDGPVEGGTVREIAVGGRAGLPGGAASVVLNVTATNTTAPGYLTVFACGELRPTASNVNFTAGQTVPNAVTARLGADGKVCVFAKSTTDVIVDVAGYYPAADGPALPPPD